MDASPPADVVLLYQRAIICQRFPAYKLSDLGREAPAAELLRALALLDLAQQAQNA